MKEFKRLDFPRLREYYTKYPQGYTLYESLLDILERINEMTDVVNLTLSQWEQIETWALTQLQQYSIDQLQSWLDDGTLEPIINEALFESKADKTELTALETILSQVKTDSVANINNVDSLIVDYSGSLNEGVPIDITYSAGHNAFPSLTYFDNKLIVFYRKGSDHVGYDGKIVYKTSTDNGETWSGETIVREYGGVDYRDPCAVLFNGNLVLKYFRKSESEGTITCVIHTSDLVTWSNETILPSPNNIGNASRGNMTVKNGVLYSINYTVDNNTFLVSTNNLSTWSLVGDVLPNTNEASICYVKNKFVAVFRQWKGSFLDYDNKVLWAESVDGITWTNIKELPIYGHAPSLTLMGGGSLDRLLVTYRDPSNLKYNNRCYFNFAIFNTDGIAISRAYSFGFFTGTGDNGYGGVVVANNTLHIAYYFTMGGGTTSKIALKKLNPDTINKLDMFYHTHPEFKTLNKNNAGVVTENTTRTITGHTRVTGNGTESKDFIIDVSSLTSAIYSFTVQAMSGSGMFEARVKSATATTLTGVVKADSGTFTADIDVYWSLIVRA